MQRKHQQVSDVTSQHKLSAVKRRFKSTNKFYLLSDLQPAFNYAVLVLETRNQKPMITFRYLLSFNPGNPFLITLNTSTLFLATSRFIVAENHQRAPEK